jgi:single-stranded DNA-binding protein
LQTRSWEKPEGTKHYSTEVVAARVTFLDPKSLGSVALDAAAETSDNDPAF